MEVVLPANYADHYGKSGKEWTSHPTRNIHKERKNNGNNTKGYRGLVSGVPNL